MTNLWVESTEIVYRAEVARQALNFLPVLTFSERHQVVENHVGIFSDLHVDGIGGGGRASRFLVDDRRVVEGVPSFLIFVV